MLESVIKNLIGKAKLASFCTSFQNEIEGLDLSVDRVGKIKFPIMPKTAKALISVAKPASFGRKDKTVYDSSIRNVWEIAANKVHIDIPIWNQKLDLALRQICKDLNMPKGCRLLAHLHNLLVYERGQFFAPHQDSEKYDDMVATLVVLLPSNFSGGSLKIDQHGDKRTFEPNIETRNKITFIAFYADCYHEVTKVTAGYRVALTYNLVLENKPKTLPTTQNAALSKNLKDYFEAKTNEASTYRQNRPRWLVYLFDHQYTQKSLGWDSLKNSDRDAAAQFLTAAKELSLVPHLALADIHEVWSALEEEGYYGYKRSYWGSDDEDDDDEADEDYETSDDPDNIEVGEIVVNECTLNHWLDEKNKPVKLGEQFVNENMICWTKANDEFDPLKTEYEGYMGNYGNTVDKWYHRAALILWPKDLHFASLYEINPQETLQNIEKLLTEDPAKGHSSLKQILPQLLTRSLQDDKECQLLFKIASELGDENLAQDILRNTKINLLTKKSLPGILLLVRSYGESWLIDQLNSWSKKEQRSPLLIGDLDGLVKKLTGQSSKTISWLLHYQCCQIIKIDSDREKFSRVSLEASHKQHLKYVEDLLRASAVNISDLTKVIDHIIKHPNGYPPLILTQLALVLVEVPIQELCVSKLVSEAKARLSDAAKFKRNDGDWSIKENISCKCKDCGQLNAFLVSAKEQTLVWPLAKDRRMHIHRAIDAMGIPVTHETLRKGSPQKLVLKKTTALFTQEKSYQLAVIKALKDLDKI